MRSRNHVYNRFITQWCKDHKVDELKMRAAARSPARMRMIVEMKKVFPSISAVRMGEVLGLDHSTIIYALNKNDAEREGRSKRRKLTDDEVKEIRAMRAAGHTLKSIGDKFGVTATCVRHWTVDGFAEWNAHHATNYRRRNRAVRHETKRSAVEQLGDEVARFRRSPLTQEPVAPKQRSKLVEKDGKLVMVILKNQAGEQGA